MTSTPPPMPTQPPPVPAQPTFRREDLREIAQRQKVILLCVLVYIIIAVLNAINPMGLQPVIRGLILFAAGIVALVFVILLASKLYPSATCTLLCILVLIPLIGLVSLLIINGKATRVLKENGIHVGIMGANLSKL
jgi:hypothetical protein